MTSVAESLFEDASATIAKSRSPRVKANGVRDTADLRRILGLPRRQWTDDQMIEAAALLSDHLRRPGGTWELKPIQAVALIEAVDQRGATCPMRVGAGKTLVTLLAPTLLSAKRPLLLIPAHLREKTARAMQEARMQWRMVPFLKVLSYQELGRVQQKEALVQYQPDIILADEVHRIKNPRAAVTKRVARYMSAHPETIFVGLSGTFSKRSLRDYAHLVKWSLRANAPVPITWHDLETWADALDEKKDFDAARTAPGALELFYDAEDRALAIAEPLRAARRAFEKRFNATPGVVSTIGDRFGGSLAISCHVKQIPTQAEFRTLRETWETPCGIPLADGFAKWRVARELGLGFYYRWDPPAPKEWMHARATWCAFVRHVIKTSRQNLDSEEDVALACTRPGDHYRRWLASFGADEDVRGMWREIRPAFKPRTVAVWVSTALVDETERWMRKSPGIVWTSHTEMGRALQARGWDYYAQEGRNAAGRYVEDAPANKSAVLSIKANVEGRNLQKIWHRNLFIGGPTNGLLWEQVLGRTHRDGQEADEVTAEVWITCREHLAGVLQSRRDAQRIEDQEGVPQKLLYADWSGLPDAEQVASLAREFPAWNE